MSIYRREQTDDEQWAPVSDLMAVIMLVFMLITLILLTHFDLERRSNAEQCAQIHDMLDVEFGNDFREWDAKLDDDLTIRFTNQTVLFDANQAAPRDWFKDKIEKFFPRYMKIVNDIGEQYGTNEVVAVRIEGHTSSEYEGSKSVEDAFAKNMELSQDRAHAILLVALELPESKNYSDIFRQRGRADGLSSSKLICHKDGKEDRTRSRRVEFKLLAQSCQKAGVYDKAKPLSHTCPTEGFHD